MKIVFFSNFLNHHQLPICEAFLSQPSVDFTFVATEKLPEERKMMNYLDMNHNYDFVLCTYDGVAKYEEALVLARSADIAIFGSAPLIFFHERMKLNKITFRFCERSLKKGLWRRFIPFTYMKIYDQYIRYRKSNLYVLSASAFTSFDLNLCGFPIEKCYTWGYFPQFMLYKNFKQMMFEKIFCRKVHEDVTTFLWVARFIPWKQPEIPLILIKQLHDKGFNVKLDMIGDGVMMHSVKRKIKELNIENLVTLYGAVSNEEVRSQMQRHDILLFTSNKYEGWGAVVNEAMNSGCVVIASKVIGSVPYLIEDGITGFTYDPKNLNTLYEAAVKLIKQRELRNNIAVNAYNSLKNNWNADSAVKRFMVLVEYIQGTTKNTFSSGPCSPAVIHISE